jgi:hypothetical protein
MAALKLGVSLRRGRVLIVEGKVVVANEIAVTNRYVTHIDVGRHLRMAV